jgi:hypothetical protein
MAVKALRIRGLAGLAANLQSGDRYVTGQVRRATEKAADAVVFHASAFSTRDTLFMSQHVDKEIFPSGLGFNAGWWKEDFDAAELRFYPIYQELGTRYHAAKPSLGPAYRLVAPDYEAEIGRILQRSIARMGSR